MNFKKEITLAFVWLVLFGTLIVCGRRAEAAEAPRPRINIVGPIDMEKGMRVPVELHQETDVDVYIHSDGGLVDAADLIIETIKERRQYGFKTRCYATKAISAAFFILSACDERIVSPYGEMLAHYPYIVTRRLTVTNVDELQVELKKMQKLVDKWAQDVFKEKAPLMVKYMFEERLMTGKELCNTFQGFCHVSYIFPILEN